MQAVKSCTPYGRVRLARVSRVRLLSYGKPILMKKKQNQKNQKARFLCVKCIIRDFKIQRRGRQRERQKTIGLISKTTTSHVHHTFLYISFPFLHDYDVKMPNFAFYGGRKQATTKFYFSFWAWIWSLEIQRQEGSPTIDKVSGQE